MTKSSGKSKWIVIGGAGFIGSNLCRALMDRGDRVVCIDNLHTGSWDNVTDLIDKGMVCFKYDITKKFSESTDWAILDSFHGATGIFYLASLASPKFYLADPLGTIDANVEGLRHVLEIAKMHCGPEVIYTSTSEVYGDPDCNVQGEYYNGNVDPVGDRSCYDESKRLGETLCSIFNRNEWVRTKVVRIFNTYGPGMHPDDGRVLPNFINQALDGRQITLYGDGSQTRSFCYVDDMVEALLRVADKDCGQRWDAQRKCYELLPINLGNAHDHLSIKQVAEMVRDTIDDTVGIVERPFTSQNDPMKRRPDTTRAQRELGWMATTSFSKGLGKTIEYFRGLRNVESDSE